MRHKLQQYSDFLPGREILKDFRIREALAFAIRTQAVSRHDFSAVAAGLPVLQAGHQLWDTSMGSPEHVHLLEL